MKIILTHGYFLVEDKAEQKVMMPYPPQGLLHIQAYLADYDIPSSIYDSTFSSFPEMSSFINREKPEILGIYCNLMTRINIVKIIRFIRSTEGLKNTIIILGGPDVRHHRENYLNAGADFCVIGEGEETLRELIEATIAGCNDVANLMKVKGIAFKNVSEKELQDAISTPDRPKIRDLDTLPFPDFDQIPAQKYFDIWERHHGFTSLTISTMRGCPYTCRWCSKAVYGNTYRRRSPSSVVKELARLNDKYHPDQYWFVDDVFTISKKWLEEFNQQLLEQKVTIRYECITRADKMDDEVIALLQESGCRKLWIGAESGSQKVLDLMDRRVKAEQVREMIIRSREAGMESGTFIMLGYPGETLEDIRETHRHLKIANPDMLTLTLAYPIKGTEFYEEVVTTLRVGDNPEDSHSTLRVPWGTYTDRDLEYRRTYPKSFYKYAIRFLHHGYEAEKAKNSNESKFIFRYLKHRLISLGSLFIMYLYRKNEPSR